jgi:hypothetical protein
MAEKSLVNDEAETLGAGAAADELALELLEVELELDELPQADTATPAVIASATNTALLLSKCTLTSSILRCTTAPQADDDARTVERLSH